MLFLLGILGSVYCLYVAATRESGWYRLPEDLGGSYGNRESVSDEKPKRIPRWRECLKPGAAGFCSAIREEYNTVSIESCGCYFDAHRFFYITVLGFLTVFGEI